MKAPYRPISCSFYDELILRVMRGEPVEIDYEVPGGDRVRRIDVVADLYTRGEEEFVRLESGPVLRLDQLHSVDGVILATTC